MAQPLQSPRSTPVEPDLPIVPMLDMSFQLMAFFLITFRPMPTEGQLALALPDPGRRSVQHLEPLEDRASNDLTAMVHAGSDGRIRRIEIADAAGTRSLDPGMKPYQSALKQAAAKANGRPGKLKLEIDKKLLHEDVVQLLDIGMRAGFSDISPEPLDETKSSSG